MWKPPIKCGRSGSRFHPTVLLPPDTSRAVANVSCPHTIQTMTTLDVANGSGSAYGGSFDGRNSSARRWPEGELRGRETARSPGWKKAGWAGKWASRPARGCGKGDTLGGDPAYSAGAVRHQAIPVRAKRCSGRSVQRAQCAGPYADRVGEEPDLPAAGAVSPQAGRGREPADCPDAGPGREGGGGGNRRRKDRFDADET